MRQRSYADPNQIVQREFDEQLDAKRVVIVGGTVPEFNVQLNDFIRQNKSEDVKIEKIEVPTIIKETQIIEVPTIIKEIQIVEIEKPIVVKEVQEVIKEIPIIQQQVKLVEVPVVIKQVEYKEMSNLAKACLVVHGLATTILLLKLILK